MGYLHQGHLSLVKEAQSLADVIVVSIYVNPGQFSPTEDLSTYPSDINGDIQKLREGKLEEGTGISSCVEEMGAGHETWVRVEKLEKGLCGKSRPVFFRGVATVVSKLFNIVEPDVAVFGKKDYQQWRIIQRMVRDLDFGIRIVGCEVMREEDGLAMSSRNVKLSAEDRQKALSISRALLEAKLLVERGHKMICSELQDTVVEAITRAGGKVDYAEVCLFACLIVGQNTTTSTFLILTIVVGLVYQIVDQESLEAVAVVKSPVVFCIAALFGTVRLIDNIEISV
ncbi:Pantoate--beta-alanine ligase [Linum perenne]